MSQKMKQRIAKVLRRHLDRKSQPDFSAVCEACDQGYMSMEGPSDDITVKILPKGYRLLGIEPAGNDEEALPDHDGIHSPFGVGS